MLTIKFEARQNFQYGILFVDSKITERTFSGNLRISTKEISEDQAFDLIESEGGLFNCRETTSAVNNVFGKNYLEPDTEMSGLQIGPGDAVLIVDIRDIKNSKSFKFTLWEVYSSEEEEDFSKE